MKTLGKTRAGSSTAAKPRAATAKAPRNRQPAEAKLAELKHRLLEIDDLVASRGGARLGPCDIHAERRGFRPGTAGRDVEQACA